MDLWDHIKCTNIQIIRVPEEEKEKGYEKNFEQIIVKNFPNMGKEIVNQVQEAQSPKQDKPNEKHAKIHTNQTAAAAAAAKSLQSWPTPFDPLDGSPPGSPVPGILQTITLAWVAISFSNAGK